MDERDRDELERRLSNIGALASFAAAFSCAGFALYVMEANWAISKGIATDIALAIFAISGVYFWIITKPNQ